MAFGIVSKILGKLLLAESFFMFLTIFVALSYRGDDVNAFIKAIVITLFAGIILINFREDKDEVISYREGFLIVTLGWILASFFGTLPFYFAGTFESFIDAFFETVSGFTTTGATVLTNIEAQPKGILFWRSLTHWLGGMGILVFTLALLPAIGNTNLNILKAESPGPTTSKLVPKINQTARLLYTIYLFLTVAQIIALKVAGMNWFDSFNHTFATMGTGGFSTRNASVGAYNMPSYEWIIIIFMFLAGCNFSLHYKAITGNIKSFIKDKEFQFFFFVVLTSTILITLSITNNLADTTTTFRQAAFQVISLISTTGFATLDYEVWPEVTKMILFILMFMGGCAGSTGGGMKQIRIIILFKYIKRELFKLIHPRSVRTIRIGDGVVPESVVSNVIGFILLYLVIFVVLTTVLLTQNMDLLSSSSAVAATLGNIGPGFEMVGPAMNYSSLTAFTKVLLSFTMILGRLEIFTALVIVTPFFWRD